MMFMDFPYYLVSLLYVYMVGYLRRCEREDPNVVICGNCLEDPEFGG